MKKYKTGGKREDKKGKGRYDLIPYHPTKMLAKVFEDGAKAHGDRNWEKGLPTHLYASSAKRHLDKYLAGFRDEDHLHMAIWNLYCLSQTEEWIREGRLPEYLWTMSYRK